MKVKDLIAKKYLKVVGITEGGFINPLAREVRQERKRDGENVEQPDGKLTCPISMQLRGKAEKETMRDLAKKNIY